MNKIIKTIVTFLLISFLLVSTLSFTSCSLFSGGEVQGTIKVQKL